MLRGLTIQSSVIGLVRGVVLSVARSAILSMAFSVVLGLPTLALGQGVIYVAADAPAGGNGQTWASAYNNLATALAAANAGTEVWVKQGTYATTTGFVVPSGVGVYGGFRGNETSIEQRDPAGAPTIMSGSNRDTVVLLDNCDSNTRVDGFRIVDGFPSSRFASLGGGFIVRGGSPMITRCIVERCTAAGRMNHSHGGGAIFASSGAYLQVSDCSFVNCFGSAGVGFNGEDAGDGGAAHVREGSMVQFDRCRFVSNECGGSIPSCAGGRLYRGIIARGGALYVDASTVRLIDCSFRRNRTPRGDDAGIVCASRSEYPSTPGSDGGAIYSSNSLLVVEGCAFESNTTGDGGVGSSLFFPGSRGGQGGAAYVAGGSAVFFNSLFVQNMLGKGGDSDRVESNGPGAHGGAIFSNGSQITVYGCTFISNQAGVPGTVSHTTVPAGPPGLGGAIYSESADISNCTFSSNLAIGSPAGVFLASGTISNSILYNNTVNGLQDQAAQTNATSASYSCIQGLSTITGPGNIAATPLFRDPDGPDNIPGTADDDYSLAPGSPCIDAGSNALVPATLVLDILGRPRRRDDPRTPDRGVGPAPIVDMGAYEFQPCVADFDDGSGLGTPDGGVTIDDLLYYLAIFAAGNPRADIDNGTSTGTPDGGVTVDDLLYFLVRYGTGC